ncbi:carbohydrate esterase family 4 protein [Mycena latifolia]|nr:carbohydrate esterase family 4 protein [Mycena latifolia]
MRPTTKTSAALLLLLRAASVRAESTTEAEQAAIEDPDAECQPYGFQAVTNAIPSFPTISKNVTAILPNDSVAQAKFASFSANIPNIAPRGTLGGDFSGVTYDGAADADCWWTQTQCVTPKLAGLKPDIVAVPEPKTLGYGFDDGPFCGHNRFYNYLESNNQKATMFYIGTNVMNFPLEAQRAVADGHEICVHTWSHASMTAATNEGAFAELWYTMQAIKLVTGVTPTCWRPPKGDVDDRIRFIAQSLGLDTVMWGFDAFDWEVGTNGVTTDTVQQNYDNLITKAGQGAFDSVGAIILTHELNNYTMQTAIDNYPKLVQAFDNLVPVGVGYNKTNPYVETNYTQPSFAEYVTARGKTVTGGGGGDSYDSSTGSTGSSSGSSGSVKGGASNTGSSKGGASGTGIGAAQTTGASGALALRVPSAVVALVMVLGGAVLCL